MYRKGATVPAGLAPAGRGRGLLVDPHEALVVGRDLVGRRAAVEPAGQVALDRGREDRAPDREAEVAGHRRAGPQPGLDLSVVGPAPEHDAADPVAPAGSGLLGDPRAVLPSV